MPRTVNMALIAGCAMLLFSVSAQTPEHPKSGFSTTHRWFDLRARADAGAPLLLRGAVAAAFNDSAAEQLLRDVIRESPRSAEADDAYEMLARVYIRSGQYERFAALYEEWASELPDSATLGRERENYDKFRGRPNQVNGPQQRSVVRHAVEGYLTLPISVDGKTDEFIFDTGAWQSVLTEREAKKLGIEVIDSGRMLTDVAGNRISFRTALAKDVKIGAMQFQNVSFAVITPQGPLADAEFGVIGMPLIVGMGGITWSNKGTAEFGDSRRASTRSEPNLVFDGRLVMQVMVLGQRVLAALDTGSNATDLNANFADMFPEAIRQG